MIRCLFDFPNRGSGKKQQDYPDSMNKDHQPSKSGFLHWKNRFFDYQGLGKHAGVGGSSSGLRTLHECGRSCLCVRACFYGIERERVTHTLSSQSSYDPPRFWAIWWRPATATPLTSKKRRMSSAGTASAALLTPREARNLFRVKKQNVRCLAILVS